MKTLATLVSCVCVAYAFATPAVARPRIIEDSATIDNPDPVRYRRFGYDAATNGEYAFVAAEDLQSDELLRYYVLLYRRVNGQWTFQRELEHLEYSDDYWWPVELTMEGNIATIGMAGHAYVWNLEGDNWVRGQFIPVEASDYIRMNGGRILLSLGSWSADVAERDSAGVWQRTRLIGESRGSDDEFWGGPLAILGNRVILGTPYTDGGPQQMPIYQRQGFQAWTLLTKLQVPPGAPGLGAAVGLSGNDAIVDGAGGAYVWRSPDFTTPVGRIQAIDSSMPQQLVPALESSGDLVFYRSQAVGFDSAIHVFRADSAGRYREVATLVPRSGVVGNDISIAGNTVMVNGSQGVLVFQLPTSLTAPSPRYQDFENGADSWTPSAGAQFAVTGSTTNHVYRQSSLVGDARAVLNNTWAHQAIEADIRPLEFSGSDRWFGLVTRYRDDQNFFYTTLRSSGTIQLRRVRNGAVSELARASLAVDTSHKYHVRLESVGGTHRVYVNGNVLLDVDVAGTVQSGASGIATYKTRADFDNVVVTPSPLGTIYRSDFSSAASGLWSKSGTGAWSVRSGAFMQDSIAGDARAAIGTPTGDQVVQALVRPTAYAAPSGTQERWVGVFARFKDPQNFYYVSLRSGNTVSLRKVVNGAITTLASAPFSVALNTSHRIRLETVGTQLRAFVDGVLKLQARDSSLAEGTGGLITYKAAASFDNYSAYQP